MLALWLTVAQEHDHAHHDAAEATGRVNFVSTCTNGAGETVQEAVWMLHSFWYEEAAATFNRAKTEDPRCAMAHWGTAMTVYHPLWQPSLPPPALRSGREAIAAARALPSRSAREHDYIEALGTLYDLPDGTETHARALAYESAMAALHAKYPQDDEAAIFYALALNGSALPTDRTYAKQMQAADILNALLPRYPRHPGIAHYLIHSYDVPALARLALPAARSYAAMAPAVPHAQHMPSHIFTRLGLWDESIASNHRAEAAAKAYAARVHMTGIYDEQIHAMDYLVYACLQEGKNEDAAAVLAELDAMTALSVVNVKSTYGLAAMRARYPLERHAWAEAAALQDVPGIDWDKQPRSAALTEFARGIGAARRGNVERARQAETKLAQWKSDVEAQQDADWSAQIEVQRLAVAGWRAQAEKNEAAAREQLRAAADLEDRSEKLPITPGPLLPAREQLADLLLEQHDCRAAAAEYAAVLQVAPGRKNALEGSAAAKTCTASK